MSTCAKIAIVIVAFRRPEDIAHCLRALAKLEPEPRCEIFIAENGGPSAMDALVAALEAEAGLCERSPDLGSGARARRATRQVRFQLDAGDQHRELWVHLAEMTENFGYAGAINAWIEPLLERPEWDGFWILNPDTQPAPGALAELVAYSTARNKGMVGSRLTPAPPANHVHTYGLRWRKLVAKSLAVGFRTPCEPSPDPAEVEAQLDAPSGASIYVTRALIETIGLMDERYFLYFEDLEWGVRARRAGGVGYAHKSVIVHEGGTTIGTGKSALFAYLEARNRIIFVNTHFPRWASWNIVMQLAYSAETGLRGQPGNMIAGYRGVIAGLRGETGRPDRQLYAHLHKEDALGVKRVGKMLVSGLVYALKKLASRGSQQRLVVLYYHGVSDDKRAAFARQMDILAKRASVVAADWDGATRTERPPVAITFDDAFKSVIENALPELAKRGFPCTIFAPSGVLGRRPDWSMEEGCTERDEVVVDADCLRNLRGPLVSIGSHSVSHPRLTSLPRDRAREQIANSRKMLVDILGAPVTLFAFPYGDYDAGTLDLCREAGFRHAFTIMPKPINVGVGTFERGRVSVDPGDRPVEFVLKMSGAYAWMARASTLKRYLKSRGKAS